MKKGAKASGARVILSEPDRKRAQLAKELGVDVIVDPMEKNPVEEVKKFTGRGADVVFNTTAIPAVAKQAVEMVVGFLKDKLPAPVASQIEGVLSGGEMPDVGGIGKKLGGLFGKK